MDARTDDADARWIFVGKIGSGRSRPCGGNAGYARNTSGPWELIEGPDDWDAWHQLSS